MSIMRSHGYTPLGPLCDLDSHHIPIELEAMHVQRRYGVWFQDASSNSVESDSKTY
jgi:hypothetical protein